MRRTSIGCAAAAVLSLCTGQTRSFAADSDDLLAALRREDQVVGQIYLECTRVVPTDWTEWYPRQERMKFTRGDRLYAIELEFDKHLTDRGRPTATKGNLGVGGAPSTPLWQYYLFDMEKSASRRVSALQQDAEGAPIKGGPTQIYQHVYSADDASETMFIFMPKWLLGRGFGEHLTSLKLDSKGEDGLLRASGSGFFFPRKTGTWRLTLDPAHALLVREAEFTRDGSKQPPLRIRTSGLLKPEYPADSTVEFAAAGHYVQSHGKKESSVDIEYRRVLLKMDEPFFTAIRDKFGEELPARSMLVDSRGAKNAVRVIHPEKPVPPDAVHPQNRRAWIIFLVNVGLLGMLLFFFFVRSARRRSAAQAPAAPEPESPERMA
jgi:hypothetical protein